MFEPDYQLIKISDGLLGQLVVRTAYNMLGVYPLAPLGNHWFVGMEGDQRLS
jgi:hypothetical protein